MGQSLSYGADLYGVVGSPLWDRAFPVGQNLTYRAGFFLWGRSLWGRLPAMGQGLSYGAVPPWG